MRNDVNKDNIIGVIKGFNRKSPNEHIMHYLADDGLHEGIASRLPKALLRRALENGLQDTPEYKALANYYGANTGTTTYDSDGNVAITDKFKLTKHCDDKKALEEGAEASKVDRMMEDLIEVIEDKESSGKSFSFFGLF